MVDVGAGGLAPSPEACFEFGGAARGGGRQHDAVAALLLQEGADAHRLDCDGCSALHYAAGDNPVEMIIGC